MPAPALPGMATGQDHSKTIQKLLQVERVPIRRMMKDNRRLDGKIKVWGGVRSRVKKLTDGSRRLYSIIGPFSQRRIVSSDPGAITGSATSSVESGAQRIQVEQLATHHQIHSNRLSTSQDLPAGKFTVGVGKYKFKYNFTGGSLKKLGRVLRGKGQKRFEVYDIRVDEGRVIIGLRSKVGGKKGAFNFEDPDGFLKKIGMVKDADGKTTSKEIIFESGALKKYQRAAAPAKTGAKAPAKSETGPRASVIAAGKGLELKGMGASLYKKNFEAGELELRMGFTADKIAPKKKEPVADKKTADKDAKKKDADKKPEPRFKTETVTVGPGIGVKIGDIDLKGYDITRDRRVELPPEPKKVAKTEPKKEPKKTEPKKVEKPVKIADAKVGVGVVWKKDGKEVRREIVREFKAVPGKKNERTLKLNLASITGGAEVKSLYFFADKPGRAVFSDLKLTTREGGGSGLVAANETSAAKDAILKVHGIEIRRSENKNITDLIKGASLNLHRVTKNPVTLTVKSNSDQVVKRIQDWTKAYNELMKYCRMHSSSGLNIQGGEVKRGRKGMMSGDSTLRRLISVLQFTTAQAYPSSTKPAFRVLADIGVSAGAPGSRFSAVKEGYLKVDEAKLKKALEQSPQAVKELFASDTNEDSRVDHGAAYKLAQNLKPYARVSGGLVSARINLLKTRMTDNKDRIRRRERSLKTMETRLRRKFGGMERSVGRSKATQRYLRNRMPGFGGGR